MQNFDLPYFSSDLPNPTSPQHQRKFGTPAIAAFLYLYNLSQPYREKAKNTDCNLPSLCEYIFNHSRSISVNHNLFVYKTEKNNSNRNWLSFHPLIKIKLSVTNVYLTDIPQNILLNVSIQKTKLAKYSKRSSSFMLFLPEASR